MKDLYKTLKSNINLLWDTSSLDSKTPENSRRSYDKPTPLDFDAFVPWVCIEWQLPEVVHVTRMLQNEYKSVLRSDWRNLRTKSIKSMKLKQEDNETEHNKSVPAPCPSALTGFLARSSISEKVLIKTYYDTKDNLVEVSIIGCPVEIHRKVIKAMSICLPFHSLFTKLTIRRSGLTFVLINEIAKMLPYSNITDICLDDCDLRGGQYHMIFEHTCQLKRLSLNRCNIDDTDIQALAAKIDFEGPGSALLVLEVGSNHISDKGSMALGECLRRNRCLLHLNLSGNDITDAGISSMFAHLMEYEITWEEKVNARQRKQKYTEKKMEVYANFYEEILKRQQNDLDATSISTKKSGIYKVAKSVKEHSRKKVKKSARTLVIHEVSPVDKAEAMALDFVGKFIDPYDEYSIVKKEDRTYSKGNMVLCSLNLAYNNLTLMSVKRIYGILKYQDQIDKPLGATGLLRVVLDGNLIPAQSEEYGRIEILLKKAVRVIDKVPAKNKPSKAQSVLTSRR